MKNTLLLDAHYQPLGTIDWQKAIVLVLQEKAEVVKESEFFIRSVTRRFNVPRVLRLLKRSYQKYKAAFSKVNVFLRDKGLCAYCGTKLVHRNFTIDHVIPRSRGGNDNWMNVVTACKSCNNIKGARTPDEAGFNLLFKPRIPSRMELVKQSLSETAFNVFLEELLKN